MTPIISIVIPINNDLQNGFLKKQVELFSQFENIEAIFVDGGSTDGSQDFLKEMGHEPITAPGTNRAQRMNIGISKTKGRTILLNHPRSYLNFEGLNFLIKNEEQFTWGGFTHRFDKSHPLLSFTSWYSNEVRAKIKGILYLDHCIFFKKSLVKDQPFIPEIEIFEDTELSKKLLEFSDPMLLPFSSTTSSIRFKKNGMFRQSVLNQILKVCWVLGFSAEQMNKIYEKGLELNSKV